MSSYSILKNSCYSDSLNSSTPSLPDSFSNLRLDSGVKLYFESIIRREQGLGQSVILEKGYILKLFIEILNNKQVADLNYQDCSIYFQIIQLIPVHMNKIFRIPCTVQQIIKESNARNLPRLSGRTVNKYQQTCSSFLNFLVDIGAIQHNYFASRMLKIPERRIDSEQRDAFNSADLKKIFEQGKYFTEVRNDKFFKDIYYWGLLLGLFTGLRLNEIAQLHVTDIQKIDDVWCICVCGTKNLTPDSIDYKRLKNKSSKRTVPIHDQLIKLGFLDKVKREKSLGHIRLFSELKNKKKGSYGAVLGEWFARNKIKYFNLTNPKHTFHSFRHTFATELKRQSVPYEIAASLLGHAYGGETYGRYGKNYDLKTLKQKGIDQLSFKIKIGALKTFNNKN